MSSSGPPGPGNALQTQKILLRLLLSQVAALICPCLIINVSTPRFDSKTVLSVHEKGHLKPKKVEKSGEKKVGTPRPAKGTVQQHDVDGPKCIKCEAVCKDAAHFKNHLLSHYYR